MICMDNGHVFGNVMIWMDNRQWTLAFNTSSLVLYFARVQSVPHLIMDCDDGSQGVLEVSGVCFLVFGV